MTVTVVFHAGPGQSISTSQVGMMLNDHLTNQACDVQLGTPLKIPTVLAVISDSESTALGS